MTEQDKDRIIEGLLKADHEKAVEILRLHRLLKETARKTARQLLGRHYIDVVTDRRN